MEGRRGGSLAKKGGEGVGGKYKRGSNLIKSKKKLSMLSGLKQEGCYPTFKNNRKKAG